jgi:hypothetical protein
MLAESTKTCWVISKKWNSTVYLYIVYLFLYYTAALFDQYTAKFLLLNSALIEIYNSFSKVLWFVWQDDTSDMWLYILCSFDRMTLTSFTVELPLKHTVSVHGLYRPICSYCNGCLGPPDTINSMGFCRHHFGLHRDIYTYLFNIQSHYDQPRGQNFWLLHEVQDLVPGSTIGDIPW